MNSRQLELSISQVQQDCLQERQQICISKKSCGAVGTPLNVCVASKDSDLGTGDLKTQNSNQTQTKEEEMPQRQEEFSEFKASLIFQGRSRTVT